MGSGALPPNYENGVYYGTVSSTNYPDDETAFTAFVIAETADGYEYSVGKTVTIVNEHIGGTADCTHKAKCEVCGEEYGEINSDKHTGEKEWSTQTATQHEQTWKCCGSVVVALENHEWENGVCTECEYPCVHDYQWQEENGQY